MDKMSASWLWRRLGDLSLLQWCISGVGSIAMGGLALTENLPLSLVIFIALGALAILAIVFARTGLFSGASFVSGNAQEGMTGESKLDATRADQEKDVQPDPLPQLIADREIIAQFVARIDEAPEKARSAVEQYKRIWAPFLSGKVVQLDARFSGQARAPLTHVNESVVMSAREGVESPPQLPDEVVRPKTYRVETQTRAEVRFDPSDDPEFPHKLKHHFGELDAWANNLEDYVEVQKKRLNRANADIARRGSPKAYTQNHSGSGDNNMTIGG